MGDFVTTAVESITTYDFTVSWYTLAWFYQWNKVQKGAAETQAAFDSRKAVYLAMCKREAELLAQHEIDSWAQPVPIVV